MTDARIEISPEPTPAEAEAIRRALAELGLLEPAAGEPEPEPGSGTAPSGVTHP